MIHVYKRGPKTPSLSRVYHTQKSMSQMIIPNMENNYAKNGVKAVKKCIKSIIKCWISPQK